jgi:predicted nucleic acid-binding protein
MRSVLLDNSFCLRLVNEHDEYHQNVKDYFKYFLENDITMYLSSVVFAEYCVRNQAKDFPLKQVRTLTFDMRDAVLAGKIWEFVHYQNLGKETSRSRDTVKDDCKLFAQTCNRQIDAFISKDITSYRRYVEPINNQPELSCKFDFIDLVIPYKTYFKIPPELFD